MIAWLKGILLEKSASQIILNVKGVGYEVAISATTFFGLPDEGMEYACFIQTIVREDTFSLFGFGEKQEKAAFRMLIKISGIGPRVALGILSSTTVTDFVRIINSKESKLLVKFPGIGKKTAERLIIELSDKITDLLDNNSSDNHDIRINSSLVRDEACQALISLGYLPKHAEKAIDKLNDGNKTIDELIRLGLKALSPSC